MSAAPQLLKVLKLSFEIHRGPRAGEKFSFEKGIITLGRGPENDIVLGEDVKVSRQHIEFSVTGQQVSVRNLSQKNPIAIDGEISPGGILRPGAVLRLGETEIRVQFDKPENKAALVAVPGTGGMPAVTTTNSLATGGASAPALANAGAAPAAWNQTAAAPQAQAARPTPPPRRPMPQTQGGSKLKIYVIVGVVLLVAFFFSQEVARKKQELRLKDSISTEVAITDSRNEYDRVSKEIEKKGLDTIQYRLAQEQYLRGFRDYRQGQYTRAMEEFQAALSFFPNHELARKYYTLSKRKFDEQVQYNMILGKRYYGVANYRLCMGSYSNVIKMKKDERDPIRREALQYYNECELKMRGKY